MKQKFEDMTIQDKIEYFLYSKYTYDPLTEEQYYQMMDEHLFAEIMQRPWTISLSRFFEKTGMNPVSLYVKMLREDGSRAVGFLRALVITGDPSAAEILKNSPKEIKGEIYKTCAEQVDMCKSKPNVSSVISQFAIALDGETFAKVLSYAGGVGVMDEPRIKQFVSNLLNSRTGALIGSENVSAFLNFPGVKDVIIRDMDASDYYYFAKKYNFTAADTEKRREIRLDILKNAKKMKFETVKDALAEVLFGTSAKNASFDISSLVDYANSNPEYAAHLSGMKGYFERLIELFDKLTEPDDYEKWITKNVKEIMDIAQGLASRGMNLTDLLGKETEMVKSAFGRSIESSIAECLSGPVASSPTEEVEVDGKVVKTIKVDLKPGEKFCILGHSQEVSGSTPEEIRDDYYNKRTKRTTICCSLFDEHHLSSFIDRHVLFGYTDFQGADLLSSTTRDGQTGQRFIAIRRDRKVYKQEYLTVDDFMEKTGKYNELAFAVNGREQHGVLRPNVIICTKPEPSREDYLAAAGFGIPIVIIDKSLYEQKVDDSPRQSAEYKYPVFSAPEERQPELQSERS